MSTSTKTKKKSHNCYHTCGGNCGTNCICGDNCSHDCNCNCNCSCNCNGSCNNSCPCKGQCNYNCSCSCNCNKNKCTPLMCGSKAGGDLCGTYPNPHVAGLRGIEISKIYPQIGQTYVFDGQYWIPSFSTNTTPTGPAGGDLNGTYPNPTVAKLQGYSVAAGSPGAPGQVLTWNGAMWLPQLPSSLSGAAGGDLSGTYPNPTVIRLQGNPVAAGVPLNGQVLTWDGIGGRWIPSSPLNGPAGGDLGGTYPNPSVVKLQGYSISNQAPIGGQVLTWDSVHSLWTPINPSTTATPVGPASGDLGSSYPNPLVTGLLGRPLSTVPPISNQVLSWDGSAWIPTSITLSGSASGDVSGNYSGSLTVIGIQGRAVAPAAPSIGQGLVWDGISWTPGSISLSGTAGGDLNGFYPNPTVIRINGVPVSNSPLTSGYVLTYNGTGWVPAAPTSGLPSSAILGQVLTWNGTSWVAQNTNITGIIAGGDLTGTYPNPTIAKLQGNNVSASSPSSGQFLMWNGSFWIPSTAPGLPSATTNGQILMYTGSNWVASSASLPSINQVLAWNGSSWIPMTISFSGIASGDISGSYPGPITVTGIRNQNIPSGGTSNGQFLTYNSGQWILTGTPSFGQVPIWNGSNWNPGSVPLTGTAGGDLSGTYPNPTVSKINGVSVANSPLVSNYVLTYNGVGWVPAAPTSGTVYYSGALFIASGGTSNGSMTPSVQGIYRMSVYGQYLASSASNDSEVSFGWFSPGGSPTASGTIAFGGSNDPTYVTYSYVFAAGITGNITYSITINSGSAANFYVTIELIHSGI